MFKQLDLFASISEESPKEDKRRETVASVPERAEDIAVEQDDIVFEGEGESFTVESLNEPDINFIEPVNKIVETEDIVANEEPLSTVNEKRPKTVVVKSVKGKRGRKSLKAMEEESDFISIPEDDILFKKQYYSIGEVAQMFRLNSSLLRYWETEFDIIKPRKNRKGDRHFRPEDIKNLYLIHHLLRQRKYTIEGAKDYLKKNKSKAQQNFEIIQRLQKLKGFLLELKAGL